jgi:AraC-like DNA-binding protein
MAQMRHDEPAVRGYAVTHPPGDVALPTQPGWHQVIYPLSGGLVARTGSESWTVPARRALCVGDGTRVRVRSGRPSAVRCLYLDAALGAVPASIRVVDVPPLARELILHAVAVSPLGLESPVESALVTLLIDQLTSLPAASLRLPLPTDQRAADLAERLISRPADPLDTAAAGVAASRRTLERLFKRETGLTLAGWRRRARALAAIERMSDGATVTSAGAEVGYATPSSFVAAFRAEIGTTPQAFMRRSW